MKTRLILTILLLIVLVGCAPVRVHEVEKQQFIYYFPIIYNSRPETLKSAFGEHGIRFGFAVGASSFRNETTYAIIQEHAAIVTTEVALKMEYTQPEQGYYTFDEADAIVAYADELGIGVHGHTASWSLQNPDWLDNGVFTRQQLEQILTSHVSTLAKHYDGKLISMDAANEGYLGAGPWEPLGKDNYVSLSFKAAKSNIPLIYNSIFPNRWEEDKALALLDAGTIDGIGIQLHLATTTDWEAHLARTDAFLDRIRTHGGYARFSEVGVHQQNDSESEQQAIIYQAITSLAIKHSDIVKGIVIWGIIPPMWRGDVGLFDRYGNPKPSYYAVMEAL